MGKDLILTINPGSTTTRMGLFDAVGGDVTAVLEQELEHDESMIAGLGGVAGQFDFRAQAVEDFLAKVPGGVRLAAVAGRGGMLSPVPAGVIAVNAELVEFALHRPVHEHASNLGAPLAAHVAGKAGCPAFIVDPVSVDELPPVARISGCPEIPRFSFVHALNIRAVGRAVARERGKPFSALDAVVAHLGGGISVAALKGGRIVESSNRMEISPFSPERAGGLPPLPLIDLCFAGTFSKADLKRRLYGQGGVAAYLGTKDMRRVEAMIDAGDTRARLVWEAMVHQIAKAIGAMASVLDFRPDAVILTGGMVHSRRLTQALSDRCAALAPIAVYPGSREAEALAAGAARVLAGVEPARNWPVAPEVEPMPW